MSDIIKYTQLTENCPIFVFELPKEILKEIDTWIFEAKQVKRHPLAELKSHENVGYNPNDIKKYNSYQCGLNSYLVENSFWLAYVLRACSNIFGGNHRNYKMRKWDGHFDGYDIWANFAYKGNENPVHNHAGSLSGVIYYQNHNHPTHFPEFNTQYSGKNGTMVLFPSNVLHFVEQQKINRERITIAFNIIASNDAF